MSKESKEIYEFGPFRLDIGEHLFERIDGGKNGPLPEKAFQTLIVLVRNQGRLVTKSELLDAVWPNAFVEENNLDKAIHAIRHVLGENSGERKYIETVRKHGYRFVAEVRKIDTGAAQFRQKSIPEVNNSKHSALPKPKITASGQHALVELSEWQTLIDRLDTQDEQGTYALRSDIAESVPAEDGGTQGHTNRSVRWIPIIVLILIAVLAIGAFVAARVWQSNADARILPASAMPACSFISRVV